MQRLPIEAISQASANQRSGRSGRTSPGIAIRLYAEDDFLARPEFTEPEVLRTGLASVIIGQAIIGRLTIWRAATAVVAGAVLYRVVVQIALTAGLNPNDMKLVSAVLVILALIIPQWKGFGKIKGMLGIRRRSPEEKTRAALASENAALEEKD